VFNDDDVFDGNKNASSKNKNNNSNNNIGNNDLQSLLKEKKILKKSIFLWTKEFVAKNNRDPTKEERETLGNNLFKKYRKVF
jgi:hypothetical protein